MRSVPGARLWLAWLAWTALSALLSPEPWVSLSALAYPSAGVLVYFMTASHWRRDDRRMWMGALAGLGALLALAAAVLPHKSYGLAGVLYPYYQYTACLLAAVFAASLGAWERGPSRPVLVSLAVMSGVFLLAAHSRGAWLAAGAGALVWAWRSGRGRLIAYSAAGVLALFAFLPAGFLVPALKLDNVGSSVRPRIWRSAVEIATESPILGVGPGRFERGFLRHDFPSPPGDRTARYGLRADHAHSELLETMAETGPVGMLLFLLALGASVRRAWRRASGWSEQAALAALAAVFAHGAVESVFALPALRWVFFACLGASAGSDGEEPDLSEPAWWRPLCMAGMLLACLSWWTHWAAGEYRGRALRAEGAEAVEWMRRALRIEPEDPDLWADLARARLRCSPPGRGEALSALAEAEERAPYDALYPAMRAELLRAEGRWDAVLALADKALGLEPEFLQARLLRAEALHRLGRRKEAAFELSRVERQAGRPVKPYPGYETLIHHLDERRLRSVRELVRGR